MHEKSTIGKIIGNYTGTTQVPVMYIEDPDSPPTLFSENFDYTGILEYADFEEISRFLKDLFLQPAEFSKNINTYRTKGYLAYIVVPISSEKTIKAAYVAGPMLSYIPDTKKIEDISANKSLPLHKKVKYENLIRTLPIVSEERLYHLGQLLLILSESEENSWYSPVREEYGNNDIKVTALPAKLKEHTTNISENDEYNALYAFCLKLKDKIIQGNMDDIVDLLNSHSNLLWDTRVIDDNFRILKNKSIVLCAVSCVFAILGNAPYKRVIGLIESFSASVVNMKQPQEIILKTAYTIETLAYLVSVSNSSNYSLHIKRVMQYIKNHYKEKITLTVLAEYVNLNSVYLSSLIKKETNLSLLDNINLIRVEEGKNLLIFTNKSIQEISFALGYNYQNHFNNVFKKFTGMTPLEFRQNYGRNSFEL